MDVTSPGEKIRLSSRDWHCIITAVGSGNVWPTMGSVHPWYRTAAIMTSVLNTDAQRCQLSGLDAHFLQWTASSGCIRCWRKAGMACCRKWGSGNRVITFDMNEIMIRTFSLLDGDKIWSPSFVCWCSDISKRSVQFIIRTNIFNLLYRLTCCCSFLLSDCSVLEIRVT